MQSKLKINTECYCKIFIFENNLREFIKFELEKYFGSDWFLKLDKTIQSSSKDKENKLIKYLTPDKINQNRLSFLYLSHLRQIIEKNWVNIFYSYFKDVKKDRNKCLDKVCDKLLEIEIIRNLLSHSHLLDDRLYKQLDASIDFFKSYLPNYNDNIFLNVDKEDSIDSKDIFNKIIEIIDKKNDIPKNLLKQVRRIDPELYKMIEKYNKIPKTRDKRQEINDFLKKTEIAKKLSFLGE